MDQKSIGKKVRELRSRMGLTTVTLAKKVGLSQAQVSRLENGLQGFRSATLLKFCRVLDVDPVYFFIEGQDASAGKVTKELESRGLAPSLGLRKALANAAFLRFAERCARIHRAHKKNLVRMVQLIKRSF